MHSMQKIVSRIIRAMGTPLAFKAEKLWRQGDYNSIVNLTVDPSDYALSSHYKLDAQVVATFRKLEGLPTGVDLKQRAIESFFLSEKRCERTNLQWVKYSNWFERGFHGDAVDEKLYLHLCRVRKLIADVLGQIPQDLVPRFSSGSTYNDRGEEITIPHKMSSRPTATLNQFATVRDLWFPTAWARSTDLAPEFVLGNRFTTVPKDSTKDRGICIEPSLGVTYQLAVGADICKKLRSIGIFIKSENGAVTAKDLHQRAAKLASVDGLNATLDMSNASDTVAVWLVKTLLPKGWFDLLSSLRSPYTLIGNKWVKLHKFSSMGCGFTFELETLIFWALSQSVSSGKVLTFGDDVILPAVDSRCAMSLLALAGFEINAKKSFWDPLSPFRESCGGDYFNGTDVRPVFLKKIPSSPGEWIVLANQVNRILQNLKGEANDELLKSAWRICVNEVARNYRVFGPTWAGDTVIHNEDRSSWRTRIARNRDGQDLGYMELKVLCTNVRKVKLGNFTPNVQLASALLQVPSTGPVPRDGISGYKTVWRATVM